jgi:serine/threonine protein kinase
MAFYDGETLRQKLASGPLSINDTVNTAIQIMHGLEKAHNQGIIHRDITPANIMISSDNTVKILDFGLAKLAGQMGITKTDSTAGTVAYLSPELAAGKKVDHRTDIWSVGVLIYQMITAELPFKGEIDQVVIYSILNEDPKPIMDLGKDIPQELDQVIQKLLIKNPEDRYQYVNAALSDLRKIQNTISSKPVQLDTKDKNRSGPIRKAVKLFWMIMTILLVLAIIYMVFYPDTSIKFSERDWLLITDFENLTGDDVFQGTVREALSIDLQQSKYVNIFSPQRIAETLKRMQKVGVNFIDEKLGSEICLREGINAMLVGSISRIGEAYSLNTKFVNPTSGDAVSSERVEAKNKEKIFDAIDELSKRIRQNLGESLSSIDKRDKQLAKVTTHSLKALRYFTLAREYTLKADWIEAIPFFEKAIEEDSTFAIAYSNLGVIYHNMGNLPQALEYSAQAFKWKHRVTDREKYYIEAEYYRFRTRFKKAIENYKILIELYPDSYSGRNNLAFTYQFTRQYERAIEQLNELNRISSQSWYILQSLGLSYGGSGELEKAQGYFSKALEMNKSHYWSNLGLGMTYMVKGQYDEAIKQFKILSTKTEWWQSLGEEWMVKYYRYRGQYNKTRAHLLDGINIDQRIKNKNGEAWKRIKLADFYNRKGDRSASLKEVEKAGDLWPCAWTLMNLGRYYAQIKLFDRAEQTLQRLEEIAAQQESWENLAMLNRLKGECEYFKENFDGAIKYLESSKSLVNDLETIVSLGKAYWDKGNFDKAILEYKYILKNQWAAIFDGFPVLWVLAHYWLARLYEANEDYIKAKEYYQKFISIWQEADNDLVEIIDANKRLLILKKAE